MCESLLIPNQRLLCAACYKLPIMNLFRLISNPCLEDLRNVTFPRHIIFNHYAFDLMPK